MSDPSSLPDNLDRLPADVVAQILKVAEAQQKHLQEMDRREMALAEQGQKIAVGLSVFFGIISLWVTLAGHDVVGGTVAGTTVVSLAASFIIGRHIAVRS